MYQRIIGTLVLALGMAVVAQAENKPLTKAAGSVETKNVGATISRSTVEKKVAKLTDKIDWLSSLDEAKDRAKEQNKLVFWVHALGDLDGDC